MQNLVHEINANLVHGVNILVVGPPIIMIELGVIIWRVW